MTRDQITARLTLEGWEPVRFLGWDHAWVNDTYLLRVDQSYPGTVTQHRLIFAGGAWTAGDIGDMHDSNLTRVAEHLGYIDDGYD